MSHPPGGINYVGYYLARGTISRSWREFMKYMQKQPDLGPAISTQKYLNIGGNNLNIPAEQLLDGIWDFYNHYTNFILNNVCQSTVCN